MPLKLRVTKGDRIVLSDGVQITIKSVASESGIADLEFTAPEDIKIHTIFKDPEKQFKNLRKRAGKPTQKGHQPSPEEQQAAKERELRSKK